MSLRSGSLIALIAAVLVGCAGPSDHVPSTPDKAAGMKEGVLQGSVTYRERVALPTEAVVEVWIIDVSPMTVAVPVIADTTIRPAGRQVPIPFELPYEMSRIEPNHDYAVKAAIRHAEQILFASEAPYPVITKGNPTEVEIRVVRVAEQTGSQPSGLVATAWRLEDLGGAGVVDGVEATLEFPEDGKAAGSASCNRFFGSVEIAGESIQFGPLGSTRMSCAEAVMNQETNYLAALQGAERFAREGSALAIYCKGMERPLRFVRKEP